MEENTHNVLIVDDEKSNRDLLRTLMVAQGYNAIEAEDGEAALRAVKDNPVDVILLDVMMPGIDGFDVCRLVKADPETAPIPVLLITALRNRQDRIKGIDAGANDFLSKPIDTREVILRVRNALYAKGLFDRVQQSYRQLQELEQLRDNLIHMIVHDMRSPLTGIMNLLQVVQMRAAGRLGPEDQSYLDQVLSSVNMLVEMVSSLLDVSRLEAGQMPLNIGPGDLAQIARDAIDTLGGLVGETDLACDLPPEPAVAACDTEIIRRVVVNLLSNAIRFTPKGGKVRLAVEMEGGRPKVKVSDNGKGIPPDYHEKIFEKFGQVESQREGKKYSTGLGLTFCKLAVEAHGGEIGVESEPGQGSTFWFTLPVEKGET